MKNTAIYLALGWFAFRILVNSTDLFENEFTASLFVNMLLLIVVVYVAIGKVRHQQLPFLEVAKTGMRSASLYSFIVAILMFCFYQFVDAEFIGQRIDEVNTALKESIDARGGWEEVKSEYSPDGSLTEEEFFTTQKEETHSLFSPWFIASTSLFMMVIGGLIYSLIATFFQQRMMKIINR